MRVDDADTMSPGRLADDFGAWADRRGDDLRPFRERRHAPIVEQVRAEANFQRLLWDEGWTRWGWPSSIGGLGGGARLRAALYEAIWAAGLVIPEGMTSTEVLVPAMVKFAPALAARFGERYLRGDDLWCQAFSEPDAGSDLGSIRTRAVATDDHYVVNGQKIWSSLATAANRIVLLARTGSADDGHRGLSAFIVDVDTPGTDIRPIRAATGRDEFGEIFFDDVVVPADRMIGLPGGGWEIAMYILQWERGMYAWQRQACLHRRLGDAAADIAAGAGDGDGELASMLGQSYSALFSLRMKSRATLRRLADGEEPGPEISVDKIVLATTEQLVFDTIRRLIHPAIEAGRDDRSDLLRSEYLYTRSASIYGGTIEIQKNIVAERVLGLPKESRRGQ